MLYNPLLILRIKSISLFNIFLKKVYFFQRIYKSINLFISRPDIKYAFIFPFIWSKISNVDSSNILDGNLNFTNNSTDDLMDELMQILINNLNPVVTQGPIDLILSNRAKIELLLLMMTSVVLVFFIMFLYVLITLYLGPSIQKKFSNKYISYYFKVQFLFNKFLVIYLPIIIIYGLVNIILLLYWLNTNVIPPLGDIIIPTK